MKTARAVGTMLTVLVSVAMAVPALGADGNLIDLKKVESQIVAAQRQVVAGRLDEGLAALQEARAQAVTTELSARAEFVGKLAEVRLAEKLGDQARVLAALGDAFKQAKQPDQVEAVWRTGLAVAQAMVKAKGDAGAVVDFLAKGPGPAMKQFTANIELAGLRIATGNAGAAEAELRNAAARATSDRDWSRWAGVVSRLAVVVDGGQSPQAGADVFERMGNVTRSDLAKVMLGVAKGRFLLSRGRIQEASDVLSLILDDSAAKDQAVPVLSLGYSLARAYQRADKPKDAKLALVPVEDFGNSLPITVAVAIARSRGLTTLGMADEAADVAWKAAQAVKEQRDRNRILVAFGTAMVASGQVANIPTRLRSMKAPASVYVAVAGVLVRSGDSQGALRVLASVSPGAFAEESGVAASLSKLMKQIQAQRKQIAKDQGARVRAVMSAFTTAAKKSKDPKAAAELTKQAATLKDLANQVEK